MAASFSFRGDYTVADNALLVSATASTGIWGSPLKTPDLEFFFTATLLTGQETVAAQRLVRLYSHPDLTPHPFDQGIFLHMGVMEFLLPQPRAQGLTMALEGYYNGNTGVGNFTAFRAKGVYPIDVEPL